ncbi:hypothetical protein [Tepidiforma sp.]|uniref:hypothetical protein n=1 Tax=Tepidiforma sp. TaxID=2682230 RepID=UPI002ADE8B55|nr:hypothetical protein [Tepidiforma sp.]
MRTLPPTLLAHQAGARRRPAIHVVLSRRRAGIALIAFDEGASLPGSEAPHALVASAAGTPVQLVNDAGNLRARRAWGAWSAPLAALPTGAPIAAAAIPGEIVVAFADGAAIRTVHSFDDGLSWSAPATRFTASGAVGSLALAGRSANGNLCLFFTVGTAPAVARLRRTGGTWATTATAWTVGAAWTSIGGLAATHAAGDYQLLVTGTGAGGEALVAAHTMGDGALPPNAWFGPRVVAAADPAAGITFDRPSLAWSGTAIAAYREARAAPVAGARIMVAQAVGGMLAPWAEPVPLAAAPPFGLALAAGDSLFAASVTGFRAAPLADQFEATQLVRSFRWRQGPATSTALLALAEPNDTQPLLGPGAGIEVSLGYLSGAGGTPEFGPVFRGAVSTVERRQREGTATALLRLDGPWERLGAYRAPATWQAPAGATRGETVAALAARAGIPVASAADLPPSGAWTTETAAFAIQAGESALPAALRLLGPTPDAFRAESGFEICGLSGTDPIAWVLGEGGQPLLRFEPAARALPAWARIAGPDRAAEAYDGASLLRDGPALTPRRELGATTDALAEAYAARLLARLRRAIPLAIARVPFHAGLQLYDIVEVRHPLAPGGAARYRVIAIETDWRAGLRFDASLALGEVA